MAAFSKQWCDLHDPEMPHDFDIEVISKKLEPGYYWSEICEGFGFNAIFKTEDGTIQLHFTDYDNNTTKWIDYLEFINQQTEKINSFN